MSITVDLRNNKHMRQEDARNIHTLTLTNFAYKSDHPHQSFDIDFLFKGEVENIDVFIDPKTGEKCVTFERSRCYPWKFAKSKKYAMPFLFGQRDRCPVFEIFRETFNRKTNGNTRFYHTCHNYHCVNPLHIDFVSIDEHKRLQKIHTICDDILQGKYSFCMVHNSVRKNKGKFYKTTRTFIQDHINDIRQQLIQRHFRGDQHCICDTIHIVRVDIGDMDKGDNDVIHFDTNFIVDD